MGTFFGDFPYSENLLCILVLDLYLAFLSQNMGAGVFFSGAGVLFFFKNFKKKKKNIFFQNRFKNIITFPKRHADYFLGISLMVKTSYAFWCWICLKLFFGKNQEIPVRKKKFRPKAEIPAEGRNPSFPTARSDHIWRS